MKPLRIAALFVSMALGGCASMPRATAPGSDREHLVVFLVRHAEKVDASEDPQLSAEGRERAAELARVLRSAKIDRVHSSDFIRTRDTARPAAAVHGAGIELYDPRDLPALVEKLRRNGGRHLVVGHSNTTPAMVELLGGEPTAPIHEQGEFDRLYVVTVGSSGASSSLMLRYGKPFAPPSKH
jgi:broad specificity phosphatase PhoE